MVKPTCATCGKKHFVKCLAATNRCFGFMKDDHKPIYCPTISSWGIEADQIPSNVPDGGAPKGTDRFYALRAKEQNRIMTMVSYSFLSLVI